MASRSFKARAVLGLYTETPLHCGTEAGSGFVDLPIQRERHSGFPVIPGSTIKGVLHDETGDAWGGQRDFYFGAGSVQGSDKDTTPGAVAFTDGFLAAFPVRTTTVPFVWVTCPMILERIYRALETPWPKKLGELKSGGAWGTTLADDDILLEELVVTVQSPNSDILDLPGKLLPSHPAFGYTRSKFGERLLAISDEDFRWLVETATEVVTRIHLDETTHTTSGKSGNMFNEELVPRDTLFFSVLREIDPTRTPFPLKSIPKMIRLGGDETIGRGVTWVECYELPNGAR
ncbi:MAG TPA: type III-B CRISPR module RAMP protein Cmr4 [Thermoanaerobaculia bacterium]|jgi:CRISPR-associated protein Cmr4